MSNKLAPKNACILVTGGAGFIGSHTCVELLERGYQVVVVDDLSNSSEVAIDRIKAIVGDGPAAHHHLLPANVLDRDALSRIFDAHRIDHVIHFAGFKAVGESVRKPIEYYHNNIESTLVLVDVMHEHGCKSIIFSTPQRLRRPRPPAHLRDRSQEARDQPLRLDQVDDRGDAHRPPHRRDPEWNVVLLGYFNPIGAHESGSRRRGPQGHPRRTWCPMRPGRRRQARQAVQVFGDDYDTPDGTGVRDYIHVVDLARGHVAALDWMKTAARASRSSTSAPGSAPRCSRSSPASARHPQRAPLQDLPAPRGRRRRRLREQRTGRSARWDRQFDIEDMPRIPGTGSPRTRTASRPPSNPSDTIQKSG